MRTVMLTAALRAPWLVGALLLAACDSGPREIEPGRDRCAYCLMGVAEERFAAELITKTRKIHTFDSIECLAAFVAGESVAARGLWVTDYEHPPRLLDAREAFYLESEQVRSPMGLGLAAFATREERDVAVARLGGRALDWDGVLALVRERWPGGSPHGESLHDESAHAASAHGASGGAGSGAARADASPAASGRGAAAVTLPERAMAELQLAIALAKPGERVTVEPGRYTGATLIIDKPVELIGTGWPVLDGEGAREIVRVQADRVTIRGLVLRNPGTTHIDDRAALRLERAADCRIEGNRIEDGFFGIYLSRVRNCVLEGNRLTASGTSESNSGNGIHVWSSRGVRIVDNTVSGYRDGIYFEFVKDGHVRGNTSETNLRYGLHFMFSDSTHYEANAFRRNRAGVAVMYTTAVAITDNAFEDNWGPASFGLLLKEIRDGRIERNRFERNTVALFAEGSDRLEVRANRFHGNGWAVRILANAEDNVFTGNAFAGNTFDVATNSRRSYSTFDGNYWDAYRGYDRDRDGIGDVPHRPVRLFSLITERNEPSLILLRSFVVQLLDAAESLVPALTPATLVDARPRMHPPADAGIPRHAARGGAGLKGHGS